MLEIKCPKNIGFENIFDGDDCGRYNNCYHCWTSSIAKHDQDIKKDIIKNILNGMCDEPKMRIICELKNEIIKT